MKASILIDRLQHLIDEYGDLHVIDGEDSDLILLDFEYNDEYAVFETSINDPDGEKEEVLTVCNCCGEVYRKDKFTVIDREKYCEGCMDEYPESRYRSDEVYKYEQDEDGNFSIKTYLKKDGVDCA